jgi:hypothetical protein
MKEFRLRYWSKIPIKNKLKKKRHRTRCNIRIVNQQQLKSNRLKTSMWIRISNSRDVVNVVNKKLNPGKYEYLMNKIVNMDN